MALEDIKSEVITELTAELSTDESFKPSLLASKVNNAMREVKTARRYPSDYTEEMIAEDMERYISNIFNIALYDYNRAGVEETASYVANGENRSYIERERLFSGIIPLGGVV